MSRVQAQIQACRPVARVDDTARHDRAARRRLVVAGPAGLSLLLAGGGLMIRVAIVTFGGEGLWPYATWVFTAIACVLAGVALLLIALPRVGRERSDDDHKVPSSTASMASEGSSDGGNPLGGRIPTV